MLWSLLIVFTALLWPQPSQATNTSVNEVLRTVRSFKDCLNSPTAGLCIKEKAVDALNRTIYSDEPFDLYGLEIARNENFQLNTSGTEDLPEDVGERSLKLTDILHDKIEEFFKSRTIKVDVDSAFEGRRRRGGKGGGKGGMMMMGMLGVGCMMAQMMLGKIAFLAGTALIIAKVALFLSAIIGLKKLASGSGGGGETSHIVYASGGSDHHSGGGGGGGWHRSLEDAQLLAYQGHLTDNGLSYQTTK